jgi:hypothetical protein
VSAKVVVAFNAEVDSLPAVPFVPDQPCEAVHEVALVLLQDSVGVAP